MAQDLTFDISDKYSGRFAYSVNLQDRVIELHDLIGDMDSESAINNLLAMANDGILPPEGYVCLAEHYSYDPDRSMVWVRLGLSIADSVIPAQYNGQLTWLELNNRPYLRLRYALAQNHIKRSDFKSAKKELELLLKLNPSDNQGCRFLLGPVALRSGAIAAAKKVLTNTSKEDPSACYELGLCEAINQNWVGASTALRRAVIKNPYIAEMLISNVKAPPPLIMFHGCSNRDPEYATEYVETFGQLWSESESALTFLWWLYHHPISMTERAAVIDIDSQLLWEDDIFKRTELVCRRLCLIDSVGDLESRDMVRPRPNRAGVLVHPWLGPF